MTQEFNFADSLHIWDTILSDPEGPLVIFSSFRFKLSLLEFYFPSSLIDLIHGILEQRIKFEPFSKELWYKRDLTYQSRTTNFVRFGELFVIDKPHSVDEFPYDSYHARAYIM